MSSPTVVSRSETGFIEIPAARGEDARVRFRQPVSESGYIDAAWWARTRDLTTELPPLLDLLWSAGRDITRVTYNLADWDRAPRRIVVDGRAVRLGGFHTGVSHTVRLTDAWRRERIDILVIAPDTDRQVADQAMALASSADNPYRADEIMSRAAGTNGSGS